MNLSLMLFGRCEFVAFENSTVDVRTEGLFSEFEHIKHRKQNVWLLDESFQLQMDEIERGWNSRLSFFGNYPIQA